jgi:NAD(P)H-dependent FMN reductase
MIKEKISILAVSGSLRPSSSASAVLRIVADLVPEQVNFNIYNGIGNIAAFDDSSLVPAEVNNFISLITEADAVFFCIPEYAFGVPGALKNAMDWTVASTAFTDKPVALITAASSGEKAHAAFTHTLTALGSKISEETRLLIPFIRTKMNEKGEMKDLATLISVKRVINALLQTIGSPGLITAK